MDFSNLLGSIASGDPLSLLSALPKGAQNQVENLLGGSLQNAASASPQVMEHVNSVIENNAPVLSGTFSGISHIYRWTNVIIVILVVWGIVLLVLKAVLPNEKVNEDLEYANTLFLGNIGIIPLTILIYVISITIVTMIPVVISIAPKLDQLARTINTIVDTFIGH